MKRAPIGLGLLCLAALVATACGGTGRTPPVIYVTPSVTATGTPAATPAPVTATISTQRITDSGTASGCPWTVAYDKPVVSGVESAATMNAAITSKVSGFINAFEAALAFEGSEFTGTCTLEGHFTLGLNTSSLISLGFSDVEYVGGASTSAAIGSLTFNVATGATLALADLFASEGDGAGALSARSRLLLSAMPDMDLDAVNAGTTAIMSNFERSWVMTPAGLQITFAELQVGPHALGTPAIVIPWSSLREDVRPDGPAGPFVA